MPHHSTLTWALLTTQLQPILSLKSQEQDDLPWDEQDPYRTHLAQYVDTIDKQLTALQRNYLQTVCAEWQREHPNIPVDLLAIERDCHAVHGPLWFDYDVVRHDLDQRYLQDGAATALRHLIRTAQTLVPGRRPITSQPQDLCHNRTLRLEGYLQQWGRHPTTTYALSHDTQRALIALWKLSAIVLDQQDPVNISAPASLTHALQHGNIISQRWRCEPIEFQCFKNQRLDIHFQNPHRARKIAQLLCQREPTDTAP